MTKPCAAVALLLAGCVGSPVPSAPVQDSPGHLRIVAIAPGYAGQAASGDGWTIYLDGFIDSDAVGRLAGVIEKEKIADATVYFNSPGGHLVTAMALGRVLRRHRFETNVGARATDAGKARAGVCYSACAFAYAGGARRSLEAGSVLGVHRAENSVPVPDEAAFQHVVSDQVAEYLAAMGISEELSVIMSQVPHDSIRVLTPDEAEQLHLVSGRAQQPGSGAM